MNKVWVGRNPMTPIEGTHGGVSSYGRNPMDPLSESPWWCLIIGLNSMNLGVRVHGGAST